MFLHFTLQKYSIILKLSLISVILIISNFNQGSRLNDGFVSKFWYGRLTLLAAPSVCSRLFPGNKVHIWTYVKELYM